MKTSRKRYGAVWMLLAISLAIFPSLGSLFTTPAWADESESRLVVNPTSVTFSFQKGGKVPSAQTLSVTSTRNAITYTDSASGGSWLSVSPAGGTTPGKIRVSVKPGNLAAGTYKATVVISSRSKSVSVPVTLTVTASGNKLAVSPTSVAFSYRQGGTTPSPQNLSVTSSGGSVNFTDTLSGGSWLSANPASGTTPGSVQVAVNPAGLAAGTYNALVTVSSSVGSVTVPVTLTVTSSGNTLAVSPTSLGFSYQQGGTAPPPQNLSVTSSGGSVNFTDSASGGSWLSANPASGSTPGSVQVAVNPAGLAAGTYTGSVAVSSSIGSVTVPVTLTVQTSGGGGSYSLLAWTELGMHCMDGKDYSIMSVLPPYNTIYAKLLTTGGKPVPVSSGVTITYQAVKDAAGSINTTSYGSGVVAQKTNFWNYVRLLFLAQPLADVGLHNYPVQSLTAQSMNYDSVKGLWKAEGIPTVPYDDTQASKPYPMAQIVAKDSTGAVIANATLVLAVSDEMSCLNCHGPNTNSQAMPSGGWITQYAPAQNVKLNILKKHDDVHPISASVLAAVQAKGYSTYQASLYQTALNGGALNNPILCASCHQTNALDATGMSTGVTGVTALTSAMHTLHSSVTLPGSTTPLDNETDPARSCYQCHPGVTTKCQRGVMSGVACFNCHGNLSRVGVSTRAGWLDEPSCQMCHQNGTTYSTAFTSTDIGPTGTQRTSSDATFATNPNVPSAGFSLYRFSQGHGSTECSACHGAQHAEYPTNQPNDNVYSTNLQGYAGRVTECAVCHGAALATTNNGGPHGLHTVGQAWVSGHQSYARGGGYTACAYCHGADYRGTTLSQILTAKTLNGKSFPAGHQMNCYDCHNGPNGD